MTARVYKLPITEEGREMLRHLLQFARDDTFPDGTTVHGTDWDRAAIEAEEVNAAYEEWCRQTGRR